MIVLDTHVWLWMELDPDKLPPPLRVKLGDEPDLAVCPISIWEIAMLATKERIEVRMPVREWTRRSMRLRSIRLLPITPEIAALAGSADLEMHGDPADRLICATALEHRARLATGDHRLHGMSGVSTLWNEVV